MGVPGRVPWDWLETRSPTVFVLAGAGFLGYAGLKTASLAAGVGVPDVISVILGHLSLLVPVVGLLGLYPRLTGDAPRLARAGVATTVLSGSCSVILLVAVTHLTLVTRGYPAIPEDTARGILPPFVGVALLLVSLLAILLGFLLFGIASLRSDAMSRTSAQLLLIPSGMWTLLFVMHAAGVDGTLIGVVVYGPLGAAVLATGYRLRTETVPTSPIEAAADAPA